MHTTLRQLETLKVFALTRSVTETARLTHVSQPAVSQTLRDLEAQFGFAIFTRVGKNVQLTSEAQALLPMIDRMMANYTTLQGRVAELRDVRAGSVSIISAPTASIDLIPRAIFDFKKQRPLAAIHLEVSTEAMIERKVRDELVDLGIGFYPPQDINIAAQPLFETEMLCVMRKDHPLAEKSIIDTRALAGHTIVMVKHDGDIVADLHRLLEARVDTDSILTTNQSIAAFNIVRQGDAVAVLHPLSVPEAAFSMMHIAKFEPQIPVQMALYYSRRRPLARLSSKFMVAMAESARKKSALLGPYDIPFNVVM